jgi:hypothetical protein
MWQPALRDVTWPFASYQARASRAYVLGSLMNATNQLTLISKASCFVASLCLQRFSLILPELLSILPNLLNLLQHSWFGLSVWLRLKCKCK